VYPLLSLLAYDNPLFVGRGVPFTQQFHCLVYGGVIFLNISHYLINHINNYLFHVLKITSIYLTLDLFLKICRFFFPSKKYLYIPHEEYTCVDPQGTLRQQGNTHYELNMSHARIEPEWGG